MSDAASALSKTPPPGRVGASWLCDGVVYEVFVRHYSAAGTFDALADDLPRLVRLGVTTVWLMPIHPVGQQRRKGPLGSPYSVRDYCAVEPSLGDEAALSSLVRRAHELGLRLIIDWVANHTAWDHAWVSGNPRWYQRDEAGLVQAPRQGWADVAQLDHDAEGLCRAMTDAMLHWVRRCDVDGFRCDVAGLVPPDFWAAVVAELRRAKPDIGLLAEAYTPELMEVGFTLTYDYPWYHALRRVLRGRELSLLWDKHCQFGERFPPWAQRMRFIDNHDQRRAVSYFGQRGALAGAVLLLAGEGVPLIYNGQEVGDQAPSRAPALFRRHPIRWDEGLPGFEDHYRELIALRRQIPALARGETEPLPSGDSRIVCFLRTTARDRVLVAVNLGPEPARLTVEHPDLGPSTRRLHDHGVRAGTSLRRGRLRLNLDPWGWRIDCL